jgi:YHS domain-containing protein
MKKMIFSAATGVLLLMMQVLPQTAQAQKYQGKYFNNVNSDGVILEGYDAVAFFTDNKPVKGEARFNYSYNDAVYYFATQAHLDLFKADPAKYAPQFGAWCAYAVSLGRTAPIDVNTFSVVSGRLVLQHNQRAVDGWNKDSQGNLQLADKYWPAVSAGGGRQITTEKEKGFLNNVDENGVILQGYDAVAYFADGKAVKGDPKFEARYNGATYWFASQAHADAFKDSSAKYAPQYGAFCGYAMSLGKLRPVDPTIFQIVNGRLILQHTQMAYNLFNKDLKNNIQKADDNWPKQVKKHSGKKVMFDKPAMAPTNEMIS